MPHFFASPSSGDGSRRDFLRRTGSGLGLLALSSLLDPHGLLAAGEPSAVGDARSALDRLNPLAPRPSHFPAKARSVIWLFMNGGQSQTDELGHKAAVDKVSINDLHATILHLLGLEHEKLTYKYNGRNFRLTDVAGEAVHKIIA